MYSSKKPFRFLFLAFEKQNYLIIVFLFFKNDLKILGKFQKQNRVVFRFLFLFLNNKVI